MRAATYLAAGVLALLAGLALARYWQPPPTVKLTEIEAPALLDQPLLDLEGAPRQLREWEGKVILVNFWATWCAPCLDEIPMIQQSREQFLAQNFEVVGIAIDDAQPVREYREQLLIQYPLLLAGDDPIQLLTVFGDESGALPHSVVLSTAGKILSTHTGPLTAEQLEQLIQPYL